MNLAVIGAGYVGLVTSAGLAHLGHHVRVGESDPEKLATLQDGKVPLYEAGLDRLLTEGIISGRLTFHGDNRKAVTDAEAVFIALPTPQGPTGAADTSIIETVLGEVADALEPGAVVVLKSTVPVGSVRRFQALLDEWGARVRVLSNPEFLREGSAVHDFLNPDRIVIGTRDQEAAATMMEIYEGLGAPVVVTDPVSSEMIKYASNALLATRITFANAIANLCEGVGADVRDVLLGMGYDRRIGFHFLSPGPGYGGSCFPKDTQALVAIAEAADYDFSLLRGVIEVNDQQRERILEKVRRAAGGNLAGRTVAQWGLAFKAGTDDIRESPAVYLARAILAEGATLRAYDPQVDQVIEGVERVGDPLEIVLDADVLLIATEWPEFQTIELEEVRDRMRRPAIVDARNLLDPAAARRLGFEYQGVGR